MKANFRIVQGRECPPELLAAVSERLRRFADFLPTWVHHVLIFAHEEPGGGATITNESSMEYRRTAFGVHDKFLRYDTEEEKDRAVLHEIAHVHLVPLQRYVEQLLHAYLPEEKDDGPQERWIRSQFIDAVESCVCDLEALFYGGPLEGGRDARRMPGANAAVETWRPTGADVTPDKVRHAVCGGVGAHLNTPPVEYLARSIIKSVLHRLEAVGVFPRGVLVTAADVLAGVTAEEAMEEAGRAALGAALPEPRLLDALAALSGVVRAYKSACATFASMGPAVADAEHVLRGRPADCAPGAYAALMGLVETLQASGVAEHPAVRERLQKIGRTFPEVVGRAPQQPEHGERDAGREEDALPRHVAPEEWGGGYTGDPV